MAYAIVDLPGRKSSYSVQSDANGCVTVARIHKRDCDFVETFTTVAPNTVTWWLAVRAAAAQLSTVVGG